MTRKEGKWQKKGSTPSWHRWLRRVLSHSLASQDPEIDCKSLFAQPWAPQKSDQESKCVVCFITLLQEGRKRSSKWNSRSYCRFGFPVHARCLHLQWETQVHSEWLVPRARDLWVGFVSILTPLSTHSVLELPQQAAFHKSLIFKPSPAVSVTEGQSD